MNIIKSISTIGSDPDDNDDLRLRKSLMMLCIVPFQIAGTLWGVIYITMDESGAAIIPLSYVTVSVLSVLYFGITKHFASFRFFHLAAILLLPVALMVALGGYVNGSAVILWGLLCPLGSMLFDEDGKSLRWTIAFVILAVVSGIVQPYIRPINHLTINAKIFFFVINVSVVGSLMLFMVSYFVRQKNVYQQQSESLLLNILPKEIAKTLKSGQHTIANEFEEASILFADMVNFTPLSEKMSPVGVVDLLNEIFSHFDMLVEKYGLEKIKTIGDCYMVASGIPRSRTDHAIAIVDLALEMENYIESTTFAGNITVAFRFGINSGPVLAGVIGKKKFTYDVWGDTVNTASRMESHGDGGLIQITRSTYERVKDDFMCESRGTVTVKGKGELEAWIVIQKNHS